MESAIQVVAEKKQDNSYFVSEVLAVNKIEKMFNFYKTDCVPMCGICPNTCFPTMLKCLKHMKKSHKQHEDRYTLGKVLDQKSISLGVDSDCSLVKKSLFDMKKYDGKGTIHYYCPVCNKVLCDSLQTVIQHYKHKHRSKGEPDARAEALLIQKTNSGNVNNVTFSKRVLF